MTRRERVRLLFGPDDPPPLTRGARAFCLVRDCLVVVTSWSACHIQWPRRRAKDGPGRASGLLVDETLALAVRQESAAAVMHWWGVSAKAVWRWRKALGVGRTDSPGTRRLIQAAAEKGADQLRGKPLLPEVVEKLRRAALADGRRPGPTGREWQPWELELLGTTPDEVVARQTRRTVGAVRVMRTRRGIPSGHGWTAEELA